MKIGIVLSKPPSYSETFFNSKIKGLIEYGYDVTLYVREHTEDYATCKVYSAPRVFKNPILQAFRTGFVLFSLLFYLKRLLKFIKLETSSGRRIADILKNCYKNAHLLKADVDWLHFGFATLAIGSEHVAKSIAAKMAVSLRGFDICIYPLKHPNCYTLVWQNIDKLHFISDDLLELAIAQGFNQNNESQKITPAIDTKFFSPKSSEKSKKLRLTTVGRLHWKKGLNYTFEAVTKLKESIPNFEYTVIGSGQDLEELKYARHQLGLDNNVHFVGVKTKDEIKQYLNNTDIYLQYSISEGFCNAVLEAQAMKNICIVSNAEGLSENVQHQKTGFVVPSQNANLLAKAIQKAVLMNEDDKKAMTQNARERIKSQFNIEKQIKEFIKFYNS